MIGRKIVFVHRVLCAGMKPALRWWGAKSSASHHTLGNTLEDHALKDHAHFNTRKCVNNLLVLQNLLLHEKVEAFRI